MRIIDLTHTIIDKMQVYPGDQPPTLYQTHSIEKDNHTNHQLSTGMHTGTHVDGAWHMVNPKQMISGAPLENLNGKACLIDIREFREFNNVGLLREKASGCSVVLFYTGYGKLFGSQPYEKGYPLIGSLVAKAMVELGITLVGMDSLSPDLPPYLTHQILLSNGIFIVENLSNLHLLIQEPQFEVIALPLKIEADSAPARVVALVKN
jgi:kynurenine formamidase